MLRAFVVILGVGCIVAATFMSGLVGYAAFQLAVLGALILIGTFFEGRYRARRAAGSGWETTGERFVDPTSGKLVEVRYNPQTGERAYVDAGGPMS
jgi:hypothetical protein